MLRATREGMSTRQCPLKSRCQAEGRRKATRIRTMPNRAPWGRRFADCGVTYAWVLQSARCLVLYGTWFSGLVM